MTREVALQVSEALEEEEFSHYIACGVFPTRTPKISYRIEIPVKPGGYEFDDLISLNTIVEAQGFTLKLGGLLDDSCIEIIEQQPGGIND